MDNSLRTIALSDIDVEDLVWAIETKLNEFSDGVDEDHPLYSGYRNLEALRERLLSSMTKTSR